MYLKHFESEKVRNIKMSIEEIREAKDQLHRLSADDNQRALYEMRAKRLRDEVSALNKAKREGEKNKALEIAKSLIDVLPIEVIAEKTGLSVEEIKNL